MLRHYPDLYCTAYSHLAVGSMPAAYILLYCICCAVNMAWLSMIHLNINTKTILNKLRKVRFKLLFLRFLYQGKLSWNQRILWFFSPKEHVRGRYHFVLMESRHMVEIKTYHIIKIKAHSRRQGSPPCPGPSGPTLARTGLFTVILRRRQVACPSKFSRYSLAQSPALFSQNAHALERVRILCN